MQTEVVSASAALLQPAKVTDFTKGVTLSPRLSDGHSEPTFSSSIDCALQKDTAFDNSIVQTGHSRYYSASVFCKNITTLGKGDGKLDFTNARQPFIYAWGPTGGPVSSSSESAGIKRHVAYGNFWMDMTKATSSGQDDVTTPSGSSLLNTQNAGADEQAESDGDKMGPAHASITLVAFVIIFPLGAILLRFFESVKAHYIVQTVGALAVIIGIGLGIYLSTMYNHVGHRLIRLALADASLHSPRISPPVTKSSALFF